MIRKVDEQAAIAWRRRARLSVNALLACFTLALALSVFHYPGGSWADADAEGFAFWRNYWCDLFREPAVDGAPNPLSPVLARLAFLSVAAGLLPFWWLASRRVTRPRMRRLVLGLGFLCTAGLIGVTLLTYDGFRTAHALCTTAAGAFGLAAAALVILDDWRCHPRSPAHAWGLALAGTAATNIAIYVPLVLRGGDSALMPIVQKLGTVALLGWTYSVANDTSRSESTEPQQSIGGRRGGGVIG